MLNLLKRENRYMIRAEYFGRFTNIILLVLIFSTIYYGILLASNSFLVKFEKEAVENEAANISLSSSQKDLKDYENTLGHIETEYALFSKSIAFPTDFISLINNKKINGINLNSIVFQKINDEGEVSLEIRGVAQSRDILINYANSFKADEKLKNVSVPISSLAKTNNIPFTISFNAKVEQNEN
jgi:hypothetical protein